MKARLVAVCCAGVAAALVSGCGTQHDDAGADAAKPEALYVLMPKRV